MELFGLNIESADKDEYLRKRRVKLGIPKDILGFFQYNHGHVAQGTTISAIVDELKMVAPELQDEHFYMGRDGIYFRIV